MDEQLRSRLRDLTLAARRILRAELDEDAALSTLLHAVIGMTRSAREGSACAAEAPAELRAALSVPALQPAWAVGGEEALGWIYQEFHAAQRADILRRLHHDKRKIDGQQLAVATQLFTPRWIVELLAQNTLGRLWLQLHPDSALAAAWPYLLPLACEPPPLPPRPASTISVLDPACGTLHFGLVAFDMLAAMYREELSRVGSPGWPVASVDHESAIAACILACNLHGIDIDRGALLVGGQALALRAGVPAHSHTLACADASAFDLRQLDDLLLAAAHVDACAIRTLWARACALAPLGALLPAELLADALGPAERAWLRFAARHNDGARTLDLLLRRYDVVLTNPPYLGCRSMGSKLSALLGAHYPRSRGDLYAAFIERSAALLADGGRLGLVTQHSFMFTSSYAALRAALLDCGALEVLAHLGRRAFESLDGEKASTAAFVLRREPDGAGRSAASGTYLRLVRELPADAKRCRLEQIAAQLRSGADAPLAYRYAQRDFEWLPDAPWVYWIDPQVRALFAALPPLNSVAQPRQGLATGDNLRFVRCWWEVGLGRIGRGVRSSEQALASGRRWFPYLKGGGFQRWWGGREHVVNWAQDGAEIRLLGRESGVQLARPQNRGYYFRPGITYSYLSSARFSARLAPGDAIFDVAGSSLFPADVPLMLAVLNSSFAAYALTLINPTVNFQVGDVGRLPLPSALCPALETLVAQAITLARATDAERETSIDFIAPPPWSGGVEALESRRVQLAEVERAIDAHVYQLYGITDHAAIESELAPPPTEAGCSRADLARRWVSYAIGLALGRFTHADAPLPPLPGHIAVLQDGHPAALAPRIEHALALLLGCAHAGEVLAAATAGYPLHSWLAREWWPAHLAEYHHRPAYWLLQSPARSYSLLIFHEQLGAELLTAIAGPQYAAGALFLLKEKICAVEQQRTSPLPSRQSHGHGREGLRLQAQAEDLELFIARLHTTIDQPDERGTPVGWRNEPDDGVLINAAPLAPLLPSWPETRRAWQELAHGRYDWSHTALRYWPDRVLTACRTNRSLALAHGLQREG